MEAQGFRSSVTVTLLCFDGGVSKTIHWCDSEPTLPPNEQDYLVKAFLSSVSLAQAVSSSTDVDVDVVASKGTTPAMPVYIQGRDFDGGLQSIVGIPTAKTAGDSWCWCVLAAPYRAVTVESLAAFLHKHKHKHRKREGDDNEDEDVNSGVRKCFNDVCAAARKAIRGESEHAKASRCQYITQRLLNDDDVD